MINVPIPNAQFLIPISQRSEIGDRRSGFGCIDSRIRTIFAESGAPKRLVRVSNVVFAWFPGGLGVVSLVLVLIFGTTIKGATSWFSFGGFSFQPSEIAKFGTCLGVAAMLNHWRYPSPSRNSTHFSASFFFASHVIPR